ncbi:MAG TPA: heme ABC exporter ATP-binding protein CcmA [Rhodospirillales bacterium]|jgi:heme exporter protein A|nr:heme ABC exporter ATP-binding protein CcmA [Rhodospirillales bacterium]
MALFSGEDLLCIRGERVVFEALHFTIGAGGALLLTGANGSGKSSLLRLMTGLLAPASGRIAWDGEDTSEDPERHNARMHYVGHLDPVKPMLTVAENLRFWAGLKTGNGAVAGAALEAFGIAHLSAVPGRYLSAGQKRRLNLARLEASPAPLWLLDEPTAALDAEAVDGLRDAIGRHRSAGGMVVLSTHAEMGLDGAQVLDLGDFGAATQATAAGRREERP